MTIKKLLSNSFMMVMPRHSLMEFRRIFAFDYKFNGSRSLNDVAEKLSGKFDFEDVYNFAEIIDHVCNRGFLREWKNAIAMKSAVVYPPMIYFLTFQVNDSGGRLFILETNESWYSHEKILFSMRTFSKNAGIICSFIGLC